MSSIKILFLSCLLLFIGVQKNTLYAQKSEVIDLGSFSELQVIGRMDVKLVVSKEEKIELDYEGIERDKINIVNENGKLKIKIISTLSYKEVRIQIKIFCDNLINIESFSGASIFSDETIVVDSLLLNAEGGGEIELKLFTDFIQSSCSMGGLLTLSGDSNKHFSKVSSKSTLSAYDLKCKEYNLNVNTKGNAKVHVIDKIDCKVISGGYLSYIGNPSIKKVSSSFGGKVEKFIEAK